MTWMIHVAYFGVIILQMLAIARLMDRIEKLNQRIQISYETYTEYKTQRDKLAQMIAQRAESDLLREHFQAN